MSKPRFSQNHVSFPCTLLPLLIFPFATYFVGSTLLVEEVVVIWNMLVIWNTSISRLIRAATYREVAKMMYFDKHMTIVNKNKKKNSSGFYAAAGESFRHTPNLSFVVGETTVFYYRKNRPQVVIVLDSDLSSYHMLDNNISNNLANFRLSKNLQVDSYSQKTKGGSILPPLPLLFPMRVETTLLPDVLPFYII
uniref:Uncharacterized protein n=1 Tax=Cacopsylla melanoneura TaxID=428564 RepID=A0A8D8PZH9_9HEMI